MCYNNTVGLVPDTNFVYHNKGRKTTLKVFKEVDFVWIFFVPSREEGSKKDEYGRSVFSRRKRGGRCPAN
jgi:hypothetical protein